MTIEHQIQRFTGADDDVGKLTNRHDIGDDNNDPYLRRALPHLQNYHPLDVVGSYRLSPW